MAAEPPAANLSMPTRLLIAAALAAGLLGAWQTQRLVSASQQARYDYEVRLIGLAIEQRMSAYSQVLRGGLGLFLASDQVTRTDWLRYVDTLHLAERYPGFKSLSFAAAVTPDALPAFVAAVRAEVLPDGLIDSGAIRGYQIRSPAEPGTPPLHSPILYVAPFTAENQRVLGVDMMQEPIRRAVMEAAAASGEVMISPRLRLAAQDSARAGFIAYLAIRRDGALLGWLTAAFRAEDFMRSLLGGKPGAIDFELFDGPSPDEAALLHSTAGVDGDGRPLALPAAANTDLRSTGPVAMPGRVWTLRARAAPGFVSLADRLAPWLIALGGALTSLLLYVIARSGARWRQQAVALEQARADVEAANRAKTQFLANMSHEIRTPLNAILGTAELLGDSALDADQRASLDTIAESGDHLLHVINDILDFSKVEAGVIELDEQVFDLQRAVADALEQVAAQAAARRLALTSEFAPGTPVLIRADRGRVRQILGNYLSNAVKFTEHGSVRVTVASEPVSDARLRLRIAVRDTGIGVPADRIDRLFQRFSQVDASTTRRFGGTGLGLAICKRLAERMGGEVAVESHPGLGSIFSFSFLADHDPAWSLPASAREAKAVSVLPATASDRIRPDAGPRVLLVEDNPVNRNVALRMLQSLGHHADAVDHGLAAIAAVQGQPYDLLLVDIQMPDIDGLEVTRRIRALPLPRQPRIYAMTASVLDDERRACIEAGMDRHLAKPMRRSALDAVLREVVEACRTESVDNRADITVDGRPDPAVLARLVDDLGADDAAAIIASLELELGAIAEALIADVSNAARVQRHAQTAKGHAEIVGARAVVVACDRISDGATGAAALAVACRQLAAALAGWRSGRAAERS